MSKKIKEDKTTIDYTNVVFEKVNEIYNNQELREKALFILYLINRGTNNDREKGYQLNVTNHRDIFSINGKDWSILFNPLIENKIIECTTPYVKGKSSKWYKINESFFWIKNKGEIKRPFYGDEYNSMPRYIQQFHVDNQVVRNSADTRWSKNLQYVPKSIITEEEKQTMNELKVEITMMKEMMEIMKSSIQSLENEIKVLKNPTVESTEETHHGEFPTQNIEETPMFGEEIIESNPIVQLVPQQVKTEKEIQLEHLLRFFKIQEGYWRKIKNYLLNTDNIEFEILTELVPISGANTKKLIDKIQKTA